MLSYNYKNEASLYIHIPFCKSACHYCNFSFSTLLKYKTAVVNAILKEIIQKSSILYNRNIKTIYLGGGTPTLLSDNEIYFILNSIFKNYHIQTNCEITIEANPENLSINKLKFLKSTEINRLSIGVQSFFNEDLKFMNRSHDADDAKISIKNAKNIGFENISIDLIYGYHLLSNEKLKKNIYTAIELDISHISTYSLTIEEKTFFGHPKNKKNIVSENIFYNHFNILQNLLKNKFIHYEISNWAKNNSFISKHNFSYWSLTDYIGIGPSAHSFLDNKRSWNTSNNHQYIRLLNTNKSPTTGSEILSAKDAQNEYLMLSLRTRWGINYKMFQEKFGLEQLLLLKKQIKKFKNYGLIHESEGSLKLSNAGLKVSNTIISELFI